MKAVVFHPEAKADLIIAMGYYDGQRDGLGERLLEEVERASERIAERPRSFPASTDQGHRKCVVANFPYTIHFAEFDEEIWIMAVAHHRRHPDYWKQREPG